MGDENQECSRRTVFFLDPFYTHTGKCPIRNVLRCSSRRITILFRFQHDYPETEVIRKLRKRLPLAIVRIL